MVTSEVQLCNLALEEIGADRISEVGEDSKAGVACDLLLHPTIEEVLELYDWSDAIKRIQVSASGDTNLTEYDYMYQLPNDLLRIICLIDIDAGSYEEIPNEPYMKEGRKLYCDQSPCAIKYIYRPDVKYMSSLLITTIKHLLASKLAYRMTQDQSVEQYQMALYSQAFQNAIYHDGRTKNARPVYTDWTEAGR